MTRGRHPKKFRSDPDRYAMAIALAYQDLGMSLRGGCEAAIATTEGLPIGPNFNRGRGGHGLNLLNWQFEIRHRPGAAVTIEGRARGLRQKIKKWRGDADAAQWLGLMSSAVVTALQTAPPDFKAADEQIRLLAADAGETEFAAKLVKLAEGARLDAAAAAYRAFGPEIVRRGISHPRSRRQNMK